MDFMFRYGVVLDLRTGKVDSGRTAAAWATAENRALAARAASATLLLPSTWTRVPLGGVGGGGPARAC